MPNRQNLNCRNQGCVIIFFVIRKIKNFFHLLVAIFSVVFFRFPSKNLKVIGVTGTDGKTTTATLIHHILVGAGQKAALISTVTAKIGAQEIPTGLHVTSPHPWKLQQLLRRIVDRNYQYVVLEVTSHGLDQHRVFGVKFLMGVVTNVTHEHLDYHKTYENYLKTKAKLFKGVEYAILNRDDVSYQYLSSIVNRQSSITITYAIKKRADFTPQTFKFKTSLLGEYNQYNCLAAIATTASLGLSREKIRKAVASFKGVKGRMEEIDEGQDFKVIIDFAHTPNALKNVLKALARRSSRRGDRLIVVFGCAGLRDKAKRPMMGEIAAQYADFIVLTAEDPRVEDVNEIIEQIAKGCLKKGAKEKGSKPPCFFRIPDRRRAIKFAIQKLAKKGDIVVICGKGHEQSMCFGKTEYSWSDQEEARKALRHA